MVGRGQLWAYHDQQREAANDWAQRECTLEVRENLWKERGKVMKERERERMVRRLWHFVSLPGSGPGEPRCMTGVL